jgi:ubiquinone/menaquinone biosynthesis C-methylase UbiE
MSAIDLDEAFPDATFDVVVSSLMFSELSDDEQRYVLRQCHRLLPDGGRLMVADEVVPRSWPLRLLNRLLRLPLVILTYALTQATTRAVTGLEEKISAAEFTVSDMHRSLLGGLEIVMAAKTKEGR